MSRSLWLVLAICLASLRAAAAVTGVVMTTDGQPVAGARVALYAFETTAASRARLLSAAPDRVPLVSVQTDSKGAFSLESPKQPVVDLAVFARGYEPMERRIERDEEAGAIALAKAEMRKGAITSGGKAIAGATVALDYGGFEYLARTDEQGRYEAPDPKHIRSIVVAHPDYAIDEERVMGGSTAASELNRTLTAGRSVSGRVVAANGETPVSGANVSIDGWPWARSGEDGTFTIPHAPAKWTAILAAKDSLVGQRAFSAESAVIRVAPGATVSGRITDAKTKMALPGVAVRVGPLRSGPGRDSAPSIETDAKGAYSIVVPPGTYMVSASHPAYDGNSGNVAVSSAPATRDIPLQPLARVTGVVLDESRKAVVAAFVTSDLGGDPMRGGPMRMLRQETSSVMTGPDGRFSTRLQSDSDLTLKATKKGLPPAKSEPLKLAPGERRTGIVLTIPSGIAVSGLVTDADGKPLSGIAVTTSEAESGGRGMMMRMVVGGPPSRDDNEVRTASDGTYTLRVREGTYDFSFKGEGYAQKTVRAQSVTPAEPKTVDAALDPSVEITGRVVRGGTAIENARVMVMGTGAETVAMTASDGSFTLSDLAAGAIRVIVRKEDDFIQEMRSLTAPARDVVIDVPAGGRVTGRVVEKGSRTPITSFQAGVTTSRGGGGMVMMGPPQLRDFTSDDGAFVLENVPAGAMVLVASSPGYAAGRKNVSIETGKTISDVEIELDLGVRLTGKVTSATGGPLSDVEVRIAPSPTGGFAASGMDRGTSTDANGEYTLEALEAGEETILFSHAKYPPKRQSVTLTGRETKLDVQLSAGQRLSGSVVTESGAPVAEAEVVALQSGGRGARARTNASGVFELDSLSPGRYRFVASKPGFADGTVDDFDITSGAPLQISLATGGTIYGRVTGLSATELSNVTVEARGPRSVSSASVDPTGNYRLEGAPVGTVRLVAVTMTGSMTSRRTSSMETVEVTAGSSQQVDLPFRADIVIRGRVTRNGTPLPDAGITFLARGSQRATASGTTDSQGQYSVSGLEDGEYVAFVLDVQRFSPYTTTVQVKGSATFDIDYQTSAMRGRVVDVATNAPVENATVQLRSTSAAGDFRMPPRASVTDSTGSFAFDSIPAGSYSVTATRESYGNQTLDLNIGEGGLDDVELKLARNDGVLLKVVDGRDQRPVSAMVFVFDPQGRVVHESRMFFGDSPDVSDTRLPLAPGTYSAAIHSSGYASRNVSFQSPSTYTVALTPGGTLEIVSKRSGPARVRLIDANGLLYPRYGAGQPARDLVGRTSFTVAPGTYTIQLLGDGEVVLDSKQVTVAEGQTVQADL